MRLWIDGQFLQTASRYRGIGRYMIELMRALAGARPDIEMSVSFNGAMKAGLEDAQAVVEGIIAPRNVHLWYGPVAGKNDAAINDRDRALSQLVLAHHVACLGPDVALSASPFEAMAGISAPYQPLAAHGIGSAAVFYDAIPYRFPQKYLADPNLLQRFRTILAAHQRFDHLLAISAFAASEAKDVIANVPVTTIDAGVSPDMLAMIGQPANRRMLQRLNLPDDYLLYVGGLDWRKNVAGAIEAIARLPEPLRSSLVFVCAGAGPADEVDKLKRQWRGLNLPEANLRSTGFVSDAELIDLVRLATVLIQPSFSEGFGLTALEAMTVGTAVIASNTGALPEVVRNDAALFAPDDIAAMSALIGKSMTDAAFRAALIKEGTANAGHYSWDRTAGLAGAALDQAARPAPARNLAETRTITADAFRAAFPEPTPALIADMARLLSACEP